MSSRVSPIFWILAAALILRVVAAIAVHVYLDGMPDRNFLIEGDANGYWELAANISSGDGLTIYEPPRRILRMPGFPLLLTLAGGNMLAARLILAVVGTTACGMTFLLARELVDEKTGLIAAALVALSPPMIVFSVMILSEVAFGTAMTFNLWLMSRLLATRDTEDSQRNRNVLAICTGVALTLACYFRPSWLLFGPALLGFLVIRQRMSKRAWKTASLVLVGMAVAFVPWVVRNYRVTNGEIVVTTLWAGPSLYDGLNHAANGASDMTFLQTDDLMSSLSESEVDRHYRRAAWEFARENPGRTTSLALIKLGRFWSPWPNASQFHNWWIALPTIAFFLLTIVPATYGTWLMRGRWNVLLLTLGPIVYFSGIHSVFVGSIRYRLPAEFALYVLTAVGIAALWKKRRREVGV